MAAEIILYDRMDGPFERKKLTHANKAKAVSAAKKMLEGWKETGDRWATYTDSRGFVHVMITSYGEDTDIAAAIVGLGKKRNPSLAHILFAGAPDAAETAQLLKLHREALRDEKKRLKSASNWLSRKLAEHEIKDIEKTIKRLEARRDSLKAKRGSRRKNPSMREIMAKAMK